LSKIHRPWFLLSLPFRLTRVEKRVSYGVGVDDISHLHEVTICRGITARTGLVWPTPFLFVSLLAEVWTEHGTPLVRCFTRARGHSQSGVVGEGSPLPLFCISETVVLRAMSSACDVTNPWGRLWRSQLRPARRSGLTEPRSM